MKPDSTYQQKDIFFIKKDAIPEHGVASFFDSTKIKYFCVNQIFVIWESVKRNLISIPSS